MSSGGGKNKPMKKMAHVGPNMTPMVDVVMCILIFFMLGSTFLTPELVLASNTPVDKPGLSTVAANAPTPPVRFVLSVVRRGNDTWFGSSDGTLLLLDTRNGSTGTDGVTKYLAAKREALSDTVQVIIAPEQNVSYQDVITVFDACTRAKFKNVAFAPARKNG